MRNHVNYRLNPEALLERPIVMSRLYRSNSFLLVFVFLFTFRPTVASVRAQMPGAKSYQVLSITPGEVVVRIQPTYTSQTVRDSSGREFTEMTFAGGVVTDSAGAPEVMRLALPFLAPNRQQAKVEIVSQSLEVLPGIDLAPVPTLYKSNGDVLKRYAIREDRYNAIPSGEWFSVGAVSPFRTAFSERILVSPIGYDAQSRSVTRVKSLTLRITFADASSASSSDHDGVAISSEEAGFFRTIFLNGTVSNFYSGASAEWTYALKSQGKASATTLSTASAQDAGGQWLQITTSGAGVYHISAQDLANNNITGPIDPASIELFGIGGAMLNEYVTDSSGEWIECPLDVRTNGQNVTDLYFYASGASVWRYDPSLGGTDGLFHNLNPYTSAGHFLLKIGGSLLAGGLRVATKPDSLNQTPVTSSTVLAATCHEVDQTLELDVAVAANVGREMLDQSLTQTIPMNISLDAPGYTGDSSVIRVAYDAAIDSNDSGSLAVQMNNENVGSISSRVGGVPDRNWDHTFVLDKGISTPLNLGITFSSSSVTANAWLDFVELVYRRNTDIGSQSIPFMLMDDGGAYQYQFTSASGGEVWDVTNALAPTIVASANGNNISVALQGQHRAMRQFIAFSAQSAVSPAIASLTAPSLRTSVCQTGADEIIIAPQKFLVEANELAQLRQQGGQATEAMSAQVVTIESIYQEFGYGNNDVVALRDFMAYTLHHAAIRPLYLTLLGGGHCDYQNHETQTPNWIPMYEGGADLDNPGDDPSEFRTTDGDEPFPDDGFFVQLTPSEGQIVYDVAVGRISARNEADAAVYVSKVQEYEHTSDTGAWRSISTFLADDHTVPTDDMPNGIDQLNHFYDTQNEITHLQDRVLIHKIYEASYPTVYASNGQRLKPEVNTAIINAFNTGTVLFSFIGHGNPDVWTHESVLSVPSSINQMTNFNRLAFVTTATCDFSEDDDFTIFSGGEQFLMLPTGGAIGVLGTSRSVTSGEPLPQEFYQTLFHADPGHGSSTVGEALVAGKASGGDYVDFYLLGDPAQRLLLPKLYVSFDAVNGNALGSATLQLADLSKVQITGSIRDDSTQNSQTESEFNGTVDVTLFDTPTLEQATSTYLPDSFQWHDSYLVDGPILFRGTATVTNGQFSITFIVPRDVKLDSGFAKLSGYAYSGSDARTALGDNEGIHLTSSTTTLAIGDTTGPSLGLWLGSRAFQSGDVVSMNSTIIVDINDLLGLNTSTASIGHSFIGWIDDAEDSAIDLASTYTSKVNDYTSGTSERAVSLPAGHHTMHVRAFDTYDNATFASVDFVAKAETPYQLYDISVVPDPLQTETTFSFMQPGQAGSLVNVTLSIYTTSGQLVRTLTASSSESVIEIPWDSRDAGGTNVADGAYMFVINAQDVGDGTSSFATGKCIVLR